MELNWRSPAPDVTLSSDRWRIRIAVLNLVRNALVATERGSVTAECLADEDGVTIVVRDTGVGIAPDEQRRILEPHPRSGAGVGILTVLRFATDLGGTVALHSEPGRGSEFRVTLSLVLPPPALARDAPIRTSRSG